LFEARVQEDILDGIRKDSLKIQPGVLCYAFKNQQKVNQKKKT
jgi:hypothetical protein